MAKRLKLRIYRAIAATLESCRSKDPSILPQDPIPIPSFPPRSQFSTLHLPLPGDHQTPNPAVNHRLSSGSPNPLHFKWQKDDKWHVVAKIHNSDDPTSAPPPPDKNRRRRKKKKNIPTKLRLSTSSADSFWFSSDGGGVPPEIEEEETETFVSSPDASSEFNLQPGREMRRSKSRRPVTTRKNNRGGAPPEVDAPARLSMFKKLIPCTVDGKVKESFAVVKRSADPYEDFKNSMMDMILEKQMFDRDDLEQLLQCFLSLNSRHYHGIIVQAFSEIWEAIFYPATSDNNVFST